MERNTDGRPSGIDTNSVGEAYPTNDTGHSLRWTDLMLICHKWATDLPQKCILANINVYADVPPNYR